MYKHAWAMGSAIAAVGAFALAISNPAAPKPDAEPAFDWVTVVNNNDVMPGDAMGRTFNSYNQPSVNVDGLVVIRARSRGGQGGGQPTHGIYTRDMSRQGSFIARILDRNTQVPYPNNLGTTFVETPSFPRVDMYSDTIATRGNHQPVWQYTPPGSDETRAGTTGIYTNPFGQLLTGASKLGAVQAFSFFEVPGEYSGILFEVFPGAPSVTGGGTIVFKGNYTLGSDSKTGVYYRTLEEAPAGGVSPVVLVANNSSTLIPGTDEVFGSTSPPTAANGLVVFGGFDDEDNPTVGGLYLAPLQQTPDLITLVSIGGGVPGEGKNDTFNGMGEGGAFDGRFVGFWGSWGSETRTVRLYCQTEGNKDRIDYCNRELVCADGTIEEDTNSTCEGEGEARRCFQEKNVPVNQGIFVHDTRTGQTHSVAKTGDGFDEFLFWNYSGKVPCSGGGHHGEEDEGDVEDGEPARWRSSAYVAVSGLVDGKLTDATVHTAFKARTGEVDGIYLRKGPGKSPIDTVLDTTMDGQSLDPQAPDGSTIVELGIEREGLRGNLLVITAKMAAQVEEGEEEEEEDDMAGIYLTTVK